MIKEKPEKSSDTTKDEAGSSEKDTASAEVRVKKEDDISVKKEPCSGPITKNGGIVGSTNTGSMQTTLDRKPDIHSDESVVPGSDPSSLPLKQEECLDGDLAGDAFGLGLPTPGGGTHPPPSEGVQPLVSNVINKQPNSMEVHYMQQQSQIFVFSTMLANSGADEVLQGRYPSIIAYHCAQPGTKKYLEKNPLKVTQFNRQNPAQWLNNIAMMKSKSCNRSPGLGQKSATTLDNFLGPDPLDEMVGLDEPWDTKSNHLEGLDAAVSNGIPDGVPDMDACSPSLTNVQPSLQGVKVPDENLTPQQRQHREEQLATIRKIQQMLLPESHTMEGGPPSDPNMPPGGPSPVAPQMEWQKLHHQFYDDPKRKPGPAVPVGPVSGGSGTGPPMGAVPGPGGMPRGGAQGPKLQGPPPPYHQTQRSASVPIALQSPNPTSPNNPTSNLSLPSPRASSALNSPADPNRPFGLTRHMSTGQSPTSQDSPSAPRLNHSNPGTPLSSHHLSPSVTSSSTEPTSTHQSTVDGMFGRTLQSMAQQKQQLSTSTTTCSTTPTSGVVKEPNLMPVPSPQQIQYLNTFEGQELIIQKQPNTSLKDGSIISPPILPTTLDGGFPGNTPDLPHTRVSGPNTPTSMDVGPRFPPTPSEGCRFQIPSPHTPTASSQGDKPQRLPGSGAPGLSPQTCPGPNSDPLKNDLFPTPSPHMMDVPRFQGPNASSPGAKMAGGFVNVSPQGKPLDLPNYGCQRGDNVPLNPNCTSTMSNPKVSHFDPISSLAQMSQQLTNSVASSLNGQGGNQGPPMMNFGSPSMHMMEMGVGSCHGMGDMDQGPGNMMGMQMPGPPHGFHPNSPMGPIRSLSPKLSGAFPNHMPMPRMMGRPPGPPNPYNGANVQVKPNAPNTIQYLPAKPQAPGPRGPPSLDFLTRLATPMNMMESKMQNMQYFPSCGPPNNGPMPGGPMPPHMSHLDGGMQQDPGGGMGPMGMGGHLGNGAGPMGPMGGNMGMPAGMMPMMRGPMRAPPMGMRMQQMVFNGPPGGAGVGVPDSMFNAGPNMGNPSGQMFVSGPKGSPMGMGAPEATQPLPPSMGQSNSFKNSPFMGPTTADPNYAQQFHNFQQQLYATGTRSQMGGQAMGPGPGPPHMQQPPYYNPK
ncbi:unnamed protein product [Phaedon cochleariae]|uniref:B-cell lymphoma 9 beta-catenin binding domain-containing protein n=1 Tax=Phaedon cochleariae TaxID=80249 RepID=A0A9P0GLC8_PHACE|nr:unnamed protein product [Phaedon cochleariae]